MSFSDIKFGCDLLLFTSWEPLTLTVHQDIENSSILVHNLRSMSLSHANVLISFTGVPKIFACFAELVYYIFIMPPGGS